MLSGMDASELGIQIFFAILLPGFLSGTGFRLTSGIGGRGGDFAAICYAALFGVLLLSLLSAHPDQMTKIINNPIPGGVSLGLVGFVLGAILGIPVGWLRSKLSIDKTCLG
jgi:hypothetical protein